MRNNRFSGRCSFVTVYAQKLLHRHMLMWDTLDTLYIWYLKTPQVNWRKHYASAAEAQDCQQSPWVSNKAQTVSTCFFGSNSLFCSLCCRKHIQVRAEALITQSESAMILIKWSGNHTLLRGRKSHHLCNCCATWAMPASGFKSNCKTLFFLWKVVFIFWKVPVKKLGPQRQSTCCFSLY